MDLTARIPGLWRVRGLERADWRLLLAAAWLLPLRTLQLRVFGFSWVARRSLMERRPQFARGRHVPPIHLARRTAWIVKRIARLHPIRGKCLSQSLTLAELLHRQGIVSELRIGVQQPAPALNAHAWVEFSGEVLNDSADVSDRFAPIDGVGALR
jgi:hypothetical protein